MQVCTLGRSSVAKLLLVNVLRAPRAPIPFDALQFPSKSLHFHGFHYQSRFNFQQRHQTSLECQ